MKLHLASPATMKNCLLFIPVGSIPWLIRSRIHAVLLLLYFSIKWGNSSMLAFQSFPSPRLLFIFPWALTWQKPNGSRIINKKTESTGLHVFELTRYFLIAYSGYCKWKTKVKWPGRKLIEDLYPFANFLSLNSFNSLCRYGKQGCGVRGIEGLAYYFSTLQL